MSFVGLLFFIFIIWEALVSQRSVIGLSHIGTALE